MQYFAGRIGCMLHTAEVSNFLGMLGGLQAKLQSNDNCSVVDGFMANFLSKRKEKGLMFAQMRRIIIY